MFEFPADRSRDRIDLFTTWLPRIAVAVAFLAIGNQKFAGAEWIRIFDQIGFGQSFRYLTGSLQIAGAILVLIPQTFVIGVSALACTMSGAMLVWIFVMDAPANALIPGIVLAALVAVGGTRAAEILSERLNRQR